jgi:uncharacterized membrane protein HdeD (DUF308 family)
MKGARIDDRISFLRGIERDWKDWSAGKNTKPHWLFLVGGLTATGMLIFSFWSHNQRLTVASIAVGIAFLLAGLLQACETWEEKYSGKFGHMSRLILMPCAPWPFLFFTRIS